MGKSPSQSCRGLSLIEVTFSLFFLGLVVVFVMNLFPSSMIAVRNAEYDLQANTLAESLIAERAALPYETLIVNPAQVAFIQTVEGVDYSVQVDILDVPGHESQHLKSVRVEVSWTIRNKQKKVTRERWLPNLKR